MKTLFKTLAGVLPAVGCMLLGGVMGSCSKSENEPLYELPLNVSIEDGGFQSDGGRLYARPFESGDKAGVFFVKDGSAVASNIEAVYDGSSWNVAAAVTATGSETCYVYFPYRSDAASHVSLSAQSAGEFFSPMKASLANVLDQEKWSDVKSGDLMYAAVSPERKDGSFNVSATLDHALALAVWDLSDGVSYKTSDGFAYRTPSSYTDVSVTLSGKEVKPCAVSWLKGFYYVPGTASGKLAISYKDAGKDCTFEVALDGESGTVAKSTGGKGSTDGGTRDLKAGDLYYSDGSVLPVETAASLEAGQAPAGVAGVVFQTDKSRFSETEKTLLGGDVHALVVSAKMPAYNGKTTVKWFDDYPAGEDDGNRDESIEDPAYPGLYLPFIGSDESLAASFNANDSDLDGYRYTHVIWTRRADDMAKGWYEVFSAVKDFSVSVPSGTTGWYLPSVGQMIDIFRSLGHVDAAADHIVDFYGVSDFSVAPDYAVDMKNVLDSSLEKIRDAEKDLFSASDALWTSSHSKTLSPYTQADAFCARQAVLTDGTLSIISYQTFGSNTQSRAVLAF